MEFDNKAVIMSSYRNHYTAEESIEAKVNNLKIICFAPGIRRTFTDKNEANVELKLLVHKIEKSKGKEKMIESVKRNVLVNTTKMTGVVVHIYEDFSIVLDCGMFVKMRTDGKRFKVGDYVKAEGRLDAYLSKEVKSK